MAFAIKQKWRMTVIHPLANAEVETPGEAFGFVEPAPFGSAVGGVTDMTLAPKTTPGMITPYSSGFVNLQSGNGDITNPNPIGFVFEPSSVAPGSFALPAAYASFWLSRADGLQFDYTASENERGTQFKNKFINLDSSKFDLSAVTVTPLDGRGLSLRGDSFKPLFASLVSRLRAGLIDAGSTVESALTLHRADGIWSCGSKAKVRGPASMAQEADVILREVGSAYVLLDATVYQNELKAEVELIKQYQAAYAKWAGGKGAGVGPTYVPDPSKWLEADYKVITAQVTAITKSYNDVLTAVTSSEGAAAEQAAYEKYVAAGGVDSFASWRAAQAAALGTAADRELGTEGSNSGFLDALKSGGSWLVDTFAKFSASLGDTGSTILGAGIASKLTGLSAYLPMILVGVAVVLVMK